MTDINVSNMTSDELRTFVRDVMAEGLENVAKNVNIITDQTVKMAEESDKMLNASERRMESIESVVAQLTAGYAEMASTLESIITILSSESEEARSDLQRIVSENRIKMIQFLQEATNQSAASHDSSVTSSFDSDNNPIEQNEQTSD